MKLKLLAMITALLFIVACGTTYLAYDVYQQESVKKSSLAQDKGEKEKTSIPKETEQVKEQEEQNTIGFEMNGDEVEKAENVPVDQEKAILAAFDEYIKAFNEKDLDRYKNIISKNPEGFKYEDDIQAVTEVFKQYDINREAEDVTIVKYKKEEAQVFSTLKTQMKELKTGAELAGFGRQITVFVKEYDNWKVSSVYYLEEDTSKEYMGNNNLEEQVNKQEVYDFMEKKFNSITNYGETYIPEIHDPMVAEIAAEHFGITQEEADAMYIDVAMDMYK